jgi:hypothetical protein
MADLPNNERDQLALFAERDSRPRAQASRKTGTTRKQSPAGQELAELADLVAERVVEALASPDAPASSGIALPSGMLLTADEVAEMLGVTSAWIYGQSRRDGSQPSSSAAITATGSRRSKRGSPSKRTPPDPRDSDVA